LGSLSGVQFPARPGRLFCGRASLYGASAFGGVSRVFRKGFSRGSLCAFPAQGLKRRASALVGRFGHLSSLYAFTFTGDRPIGVARNFYAGFAGFGEANGDGLLYRASTMHSMADVLDLLTHELAGLRGRGFALFEVFVCSGNYVVFRRFLTPW
jgi:hypothetical protein